MVFAKCCLVCLFCCTFFFLSPSSWSAAALLPASSSSSSYFPCPSSSASLDWLEEDFFVQPLADNHFLVQLEISITSKTVQGDHYDVFPKDLAKLLRHVPVRSFSAHLTQGRWKSNRWGPSSVPVQPNGGIFTADIYDQNKNTWSHLVNSVGAMTSSCFGHLHDLNTAQAVLHSQDGLSTTYVGSLPVEGFCTENLTQWKKLLPCRGQTGLSTLFHPVPYASSPYRSVGLKASRVGSKFHLLLSLTAVFPQKIIAHKAGLSLHHLFSTSPASACALSDHSRIFLRLSPAVRGLQDVQQPFRLSDGSNLFVISPEDLSAISSVRWADLLASPLQHRFEHRLIEVDRQEIGSLLTNKPERLQASLLFIFTNRSPTVTHTFSYHDFLQSFLKPLLHTITVEWTPVDDNFRQRGDHTQLQEPQKVYRGSDAVKALGIQWEGTDGLSTPTRFSFSTKLHPNMRLIMRFEILKQHMHYSRTGFSGDRGQDISSGVVLHKPRTQFQWSPRPVWLQCLEQTPRSNVTTTEMLVDEGEWLWLFTEAMVVTTNLPDGSMPFNVIAITSTALTFFFGALFRMTTAKLDKVEEDAAEQSGEAETTDEDKTD
eukprot:GHVS01042564.1.p1 GENE.GHVS01042564.1~~GHVS01042564.1.p1  ORF type:complete len:599 (+),score=94.23 GHVS01042564.1:41-1837(+)